MYTARNKGRLALGAAVVGAALALSGCASADPLGSGSSTGASSTPDSSTSTGTTDTIVVGSQAYYSNEIIAEIYAQALENAGYTVQRQFQIGQRDAYLPALEKGDVDVFPEYTGNLLQYYDPKTTATKSDEVYAELKTALPDGLTVLEQSPATDQDSYNVTKEFADKYSASSIADLAAVNGLVLGGNAELEDRPYGPQGLASVYGVTVDFQATGDTTVDALVAGTIDIANVYSADPRIASQGLVTLADPEGLFLASNVVPLVNADIADELAAVLDPIDAALTPEGLTALNVLSVDKQESSDQIATDWLTENGLLS
ncbi:MAG: transporter substrate-binding protein [Naasia sp.]|jgi:osmoprotectant transport system substrate-binding protein|uniref:ABC transporter substrate-binding protein n=1 Tax=Naasia sp. TaxID=2546198 RepID=UPI00262168F0|nr:ABC transporter substrate-binding protein [Naasia sp.]MCU1570765.1 transporter substrate-binding protein [Naasia sp.]